jgi:hypothetical protein
LTRGCGHRVNGGSLPLRRARWRFIGVGHLSILLYRPPRPFTSNRSRDGQGGEGNVEVCGFQRTEKISVSRQSRWDTGDRQGTTTIMQFRAVVDRGAAFSRLKQAYLGCTPADFDRPDHTDVKAHVLQKKGQMRLVWTLWTSAAKNSVQRAEGLAVTRAGGALIITRSITTDKSDVRPGINAKLTDRQYEKYRTAARYRSPAWVHEKGPVLLAEQPGHLTCAGVTGGIPCRSPRAARHRRTSFRSRRRSRRTPPSSTWPPWLLRSARPARCCTGRGRYLRG